MAGGGGGELKRKVGSSAAVRLASALGALKAVPNHYSYGVLRGLLGAGPSKKRLP